MQQRLQMVIQSTRGGLGGGNEYGEEVKKKKKKKKGSSDDEEGPGADDAKKKKKEKEKEKLKARGDKIVSTRGGDKMASTRGGDKMASTRGGDKMASTRGGDKKKKKKKDSSGEDDTGISARADKKKKQKIESSLKKNKKGVSDDDPYAEIDKPQKKSKKETAADKVMASYRASMALTSQILSTRPGQGLMSQRGGAKKKKKREGSVRMKDYYTSTSPNDQDEPQVVVDIFEGVVSEGDEQQQGVGEDAGQSSTSTSSSQSLERLLKERNSEDSTRAARSLRNTSSVLQKQRTAGLALFRRSLFNRRKKLRDQDDAMTGVVMSPGGVGGKPAKGQLVKSPQTDIDEVHEYVDDDMTSSSSSSESEEEQEPVVHLSQVVGTTLRADNKKDSVVPVDVVLSAQVGSMAMVLPEDKEKDIKEKDIKEKDIKDKDIKDRDIKDRDIKDKDIKDRDIKDMVVVNRVDQEVLVQQSQSEKEAVVAKAAVVEAERLLLPGRERERRPSKSLFHSKESSIFNMNTTNTAGRAPSRGSSADFGTRSSSSRSGTNYMSDSRQRVSVFKKAARTLPSHLESRTSSSRNEELHQRGHPESRTSMFLLSELDQMISQGSSHSPGSATTTNPTDSGIVELLPQRSPQRPPHQAHQGHSTLSAPRGTAQPHQEDSTTSPVREQTGARTEKLDVARMRREGESVQPIEMSGGEEPEPPPPQMDSELEVSTSIDVSRELPGRGFKGDKQDDSVSGRRVVDGDDSRGKVLETSTGREADQKERLRSSGGKPGSPSKGAALHREGMKNPDGRKKTDVEQKDEGTTRKQRSSRRSSRMKSDLGMKHSEPDRERSSTDRDLSPYHSEGAQSNKNASFIPPKRRSLFSAETRKPGSSDHASLEEKMDMIFEEMKKIKEGVEIMNSSGLRNSASGQSLTNVGAGASPGIIKGEKGSRARFSSSRERKSDVARKGMKLQDKKAKVIGVYEENVILGQRTQHHHHHEEFSTRTTSGTIITDSTQQTRQSGGRSTSPKQSLFATKEGASTDSSFLFARRSSRSRSSNYGVKDLDEQEFLGRTTSRTKPPEQDLLGRRTTAPMESWSLGTRKSKTSLFATKEAPPWATNLANRRGAPTGVVISRGGGRGSSRQSHFEQKQNSNYLLQASST
ncbi:unnamed protein product [Amoebophrya sp. A25]|nr:unnamed protein product [Amoebophrya sp. A25]|eukprot:GSA25T00004884001.1